MARITYWRNQHVLQIGAPSALRFQDGGRRAPSLAVLFVAFTVLHTEQVMSTFWSMVVDMFSLVRFGKRAAKRRQPLRYKLMLYPGDERHPDCLLGGIVSGLVIRFSY
jgi:hypothetical protein